MDCGLFQINPIWQYGPTNPFSVTAPHQPDWYIGWLGAAPCGWAARGTCLLPGSFLISELFLAGRVLPGLRSAR